MVCYHPDKKIIYIHVPKTGGMTIEKILIVHFGFLNFTFDKGAYEFLYKNNEKIGFYKYILKYSNESKIYDLESFFKFTFVRNPYTRSYSGIRYLHDRSLERLDKFPDNLFDFYEACKNDIFFYSHFILTQSECLRNLNGDINYDFIGRFENFDNDLDNIIFNILQFPRMNISEIHIHKSNPNILSFNKDDVDIMTEIIAEEDFINLNYPLKDNI